MIIKYSIYNESIRSKMTPVSTAKQQEAFDKLAREITNILKDYSDMGFTNEADTYNWVYDHKPFIIEYMEENNFDEQSMDPEYIVMVLMKQYDM